MMSELGRLLVIFGAALVIIGLLMIWLPKIPLLGKLPGDIVWRRGNFNFYFPLATGILLSVVLTLLFRLFFRK